MKLIAKAGLFRYILLIAVIAILAGTLFVGEPVGLSDNGDFTRVMTPNHIAYGPVPKEPFVFISSYSVTPEGPDKFYATTQNVFIKLSIVLNSVYDTMVGKNRSAYDIRFLGIIYSMLFAFIMGLIFFGFRTGRKWLDILFGALACLVLCDIGYTAYFNSFYGEAVQYASFVLIFASAAAAVLSRKPGLLHFLSYYAGVVIFIGSKFANIPLGVILAAAGLSFLLFKDIGRLARASVAVLFAAAVASAVLFYYAVPGWMDRQTSYQAVFNGVLRGSPDPAADLSQLGLPAYMADLADTNFYTAGKKVDINSQKFQKDFYSGISKGKLLEYYARNPARLWDKLVISCKYTNLIRPGYLSNYRSSHSRLTFSNRFSLWSSIRERLPFGNVHFVIVFMGLSFSVILFEFINALRRGNRRTLAACIYGAALLAVTAANLAIPVITNGESDLQKHLFAYVTGIDLLMLALVAWALYKASLLYGSLKAKIGSNAVKPGFFITGILAAALLISLYAFLSSAAGKQAKPNGLAPGAYISLGEAGGSRLEWRVLSHDAEGALLLADKPVAYRPFDSKPAAGDANRRKYGSNFWPDSSLRAWLNKDFLKGFTSTESGLIRNYRNRVLLSGYDKTKASGGDNEFSWSYVPSLVDFGYDRAYYTYSNDRVFLLDVRQFRELLADSHGAFARDFKYWLETAYYNNSSMVRVVDTDGNVYMKDASVEGIAVLPAMYINPDAQGAAITGGDGSRGRPFGLSAR